MLLVALLGYYGYQPHDIFHHSPGLYAGGGIQEDLDELHLENFYSHKFTIQKLSHSKSATTQMGMCAAIYDKSLGCS